MAARDRLEAAGRTFRQLRQLRAEIAEAESGLRGIDPSSASTHAGDPSWRTADLVERISAMRFRECALAAEVDEVRAAVWLVPLPDPAERELCASCLMAHYVEGYAYAQIGEVVGLDWLAVRSLCERGIRALDKHRAL